MFRTNLNSYGVLVDIEVEDEDLRHAVDLILPPGWQPSDQFPEDGHFTLAGRDDGGYAVLADGSPIGTGLAADVALHVLDAQIRQRIAALARDRVFVHAGAVAFEDRALLLPGRSFSGKTTLVAALVSLGATYYSDEFAVLDSAGAVHPYPRSLSIRRDGESYGDYTPVDMLGGAAGTAHARVALIAVTSYSPGQRWAPVSRGPGSGALALLKNAVSAQLWPEATLRAVSRAAANAVTWEGKRGEAVDAAAMLSAAFDRPAAYGGGS